MPFGNPWNNRRDLGIHTEFFSDGVNDRYGRNEGDHLFSKDISSQTKFP